MGAYLSEPVTEKVSTDESSGSVQCGASCMQGWRINQEDAHNTLLNFDTNTVLFAVYDGHGGAEVAAYCSQKLPDYIKNTEAYKNNDITKALEDAFLGFDALIATKEVMKELKEIAGQMNPPADENEESSEEEENMSTLYQDAALPLPEVLAKYQGDRLNAAVLRTKLGDGVPLSPCLRGKKDSQNFEEATGSSSADASSVAATSSSAPGSVSAAPDGSEDTTSSANDVGQATTDDVSSTSAGDNHDKELNGEVSTSEADESVVARDVGPAPDSSADRAGAGDAAGPPQGAAPPPACNGDVSESRAEEGGISSSNGDIDKGKGKAKGRVTSSREALKKIIPRRVAADMFKQLLLGAACEDDSDSDDNFEGKEDESDEERVNGAESSDEEDGLEEGSGEEEDEGEEDSSDEEFCGGPGGVEEPGSDSGCTAVVALIRGSELHVANAGDSRCVVCRDGVALDMSVDHKPEDPPELDRITKAGGKVSQDGRINGGLNLSRAIGDHAYKQNAELDARRQMITALPDVRTLSIDPQRDEFMVLACDGIWNFMSSQDVCDFVRPRLKEGREKLSQICEEMFDHCLAPNTLGDGTGCDNMTAILVTFRTNARGDAVVASADAAKRTADADADDQPPPDAKRQRVEDSCSVVTSSV